MWECMHLIWCMIVRDLQNVRMHAFAASVVLLLLSDASWASDLFSVIYFFLISLVSFPQFHRFFSRQVLANKAVMQLFAEMVSFKCIFSVLRLSLISINQSEYCTWAVYHLPGNAKGAFMLHYSLCTSSSLWPIKSGLRQDRHAPAQELVFHQRVCFEGNSEFTWIILLYNIISLLHPITDWPDADYSPIDCTRAQHYVRIRLKTPLWVFEPK